MKKQPKPSLRRYLDKYSKIQKDILLCSRLKNEGEGSGWQDRCLYLEGAYSAKKHYNHRITLDNEIVIEFDEEDLKVNAKMADVVCKRLAVDGVKYSRWFSGSKSEHVHFFINPRKASNLSLLKSAIMRHYTKGLEFKPDLQLAHKHLIRAEYGLNEKTGKYKVRLFESHNYPELAEVSVDAWKLYLRDMSWIMKRTLNTNIKDISNSAEIKMLLDTTYFNDKLKDGRSRIIFVLSNVLKTKYERKDLIDLLQKWYKYTSGNKLSPGQIAYQVNSAYKTDKSPGINYIMQLLRELGIE